MSENLQYEPETTRNRWVWWTLILLPPTLTAVKMNWFGLVFPYWDAWHFADFLERYDAGAIGALDFWGQHNEHRPLFPRLLMFVLAQLSGWKVALELVANLLLAGIGFTALLLLTRRSTFAEALPWLAVALSFLTFSWAQMENWVWGWQIQVFMSTAAVSAGVAMLTLKPASIPAFVGALVCGVIASYSFANGLIYWIAAAPLIALAPTLDRPQRAIRGIVWVAVAAIVIQSYLFDYHKPEVSPSLSDIFSAPAAFAGYVVLYLGAPVVGLFTRPAWHGIAPPVAAWAYLPGLAGLLGMGALKIILFRRGQDAVWRMAPWLCLAAYAIFSAGLTAAGRAAFGMEHALTSRYITIGTLFWCGLIGLIGIAIDEFRIRESADPRRRGMFRGLAALLFLVLMGRVHTNQSEWEQIANWKRMGWEAIRAGHDSPLYLGDLGEHPQDLATRHLPFLRETQRCGLKQEGQGDPARAEAFILEAKNFVAMNLLGQAAVYLQTALILNPDRDYAKEMLAEVQQQIANRRSTD